MSLLGLFALLLVAVSYLSHIWTARKYKKIISDLESRNMNQGADLEKLKLLVAKKTKELQNSERQCTILGVKNESLEDQFTQYKHDHRRHQQEFEHLARQILEQQGKNFKLSQAEQMSSILQPFKERINHFEQRLSKNAEADLERHHSLKQEIKLLNMRSQQVASDANKLAQALSRDFKKQGNWGEIVLESILDKSGLVKDREYKIQNSIRTSDAQTLRPDVILYLPDEKSIVIDSKVSLNAYVKYMNSMDADEAREYKKAHTQALKNHINELADKRYAYEMDAGTPDFVLMFIPIDTAFSIALEEEQELYQYAFDRNIVIVTSSTLLATLKTIETIWRNEKQHKNAQKIALEAGKMYDKLVSFLSDLEKVGHQIHLAQNRYDDALKKLSEGKGNVLSKAEKLKKMGAITHKQITPKYLEEEQ